MMGDSCPTLLTKLKEKVTQIVARHGVHIVYGITKGRKAQNTVGTYIWSPADWRKPKNNIFVKKKKSKKKNKE